MTDKTTLTTGEAAKYCGVNFRTVIRWIERGHLKAYKLPGRGDNRIRIDDFTRFLRETGIPIPAELQSAGQNILVVDDDVKMARAIKRVLMRQGYDVQLAHDGFQAGALLEPFKPSLMTLDLKMPTLDGFAVLKHLQEQQLAIKVLVISGESSTELDKALAAGADDILQKPFENSVLTEKVKRLLDDV